MNPHEKNNFQNKKIKNVLVNIKKDMLFSKKYKINILIY